MNRCFYNFSYIYTIAFIQIFVISKIQTLDSVIVAFIQIFAILKIQTLDSVKIVSCFRKKNINIDGTTGTTWQKYKKQGVVLQRTDFCIFKAPAQGAAAVRARVYVVCVLLIA